MGHTYTGKVFVASWKFKFKWHPVFYLAALVEGLNISQRGDHGTREEGEEEEGGGKEERSLLNHTMPIRSAAGVLRREGRLGAGQPEGASQRRWGSQSRQNGYFKGL